MPAERQRPHSALPPRAPVCHQQRRRPETAPIRRVEEHVAGLSEWISDDTDPLDESLDRSRDVVSAFWDLQVKLGQSESRLTEALKARADSSQAIRTLEASDAEARSCLKVAVSRLEVAETTATLTAQQLRLTEDQLRLSQEEVARLHAVNASLGNQMESQRADFLAEADDYVERYAALKAKHEVLHLAHDSLQRHYALSNSALDSSIAAHQVYKADVHSIQAGFERVLSLQQQELERLLADCASSKKARVQLDRVLMTNKRLEESMATAEAQATQSLSHAMKVLRKHIFAQDVEILSRCFGNWSDGVRRVQAVRKRMEQNRARTLLGMAAYDEAMQSHFLTIWALSARALRRERVLRTRSVNVLAALENQLHQHVEELTWKCFDGWRGILGRKKAAQMRQQKMLQRSISISSRGLLMDCMVALRHLIQISKRERQLKANRQKAVQALRKQFYYQSLALHERVLESWRDAVATDKLFRDQKKQNVCRALRIQANLDLAKQVQCFTSWAYVIEVAKQAHAFEKHKHRSLLAFQKEVVHHDEVFLHRCLEHWRSLAKEARHCQERFLENVSSTLRTIVVQEKQLCFRCFSSWANEVCGVVHMKKLHQQRENNVTRILREVSEFQQSFLKQCLLYWFLALTQAKRLGFEQASLDLHAKLDADADARLIATRSRNEQLVKELSKLRQEFDEMSQALHASRTCAVELEDVVRQRDSTIERLTCAEEAKVVEINRLTIELTEARRKNDMLWTIKQDAEKLQMVVKELAKHRDNTKALFDFSQRSCEGNTVALKDFALSLATAQEDLRQSKERLTSAENEVDKLRAAKQSLEQDRDDAQRQIDTIEQRLSEIMDAGSEELLKQKAEALKLLKDVEERLTTAQSLLQDREQQLVEAQGAIEQANEHCSRQSTEIAKLQETVELVQAQLARAEKDLIEADERLKDPVDAVRHLTEQLKEVRVELEERDMKLVAVCKELESLKALHDIAVAERDASRRKHEELEQRLEEVQLAGVTIDHSLKTSESNLLQMTQRCKDLQQQLMELELTNTETTRELRALEEESGKNGAGMKEMALELDDMRRQRDEARSRLDACEKDRENLRQSSERSHQRCDDLQLQLDESGAGLRKLAQELDELRCQRDEELIALEREREDFRSKWLIEQQKNTATEKELEQIKKLCEDLMQKLEAAELKYEGMLRELEIAQERLGKNGAGMKEMALELDDMRRQRDEARSRLDACEKDRENLRQSSERSQQRCDDLQVQLDESGAGLRKLAQELELRCQRDEELIALEREREDFRSKWLIAQQKNTETEKELEQINTLCEDLMQKLEAAELKHEGMLRELEIAQERLGKNDGCLKSELEAAQHQGDEVRRKLDQCENEKEDFRQKWLAEVQQSADSEAHYQDQLRQTKQQCEDLQRQLEDIRHEYGEQTLELQSVSADLRKKEVEYQSLSRELEDVCSQRDDARSKVSSCELEIEDLIQRCSEEERLRLAAEKASLSCQTSAQVATQLLDAESKTIQLQNEIEHLRSQRTRSRAALFESVESVFDLRSRILLSKCMLQWHVEARATYFCYVRKQIVSRLVLQRIRTMAQDLLDEIFMIWVLAWRASREARTFKSKREAWSSALQAEMCRVGFSSLLVLRLWKHALGTSGPVKVVSVDREYNFIQLQSENECLRLQGTRSRAAFHESVQRMVDLRYRMLLSKCTLQWHAEARMARGLRKYYSLGMNMTSMKMTDSMKQLQSSCFDFWLARTRAVYRQGAEKSNGEEKDQVSDDIEKYKREFEELRSESTKSGFVIETLQRKIEKAESDSDLLRGQLSVAEHDAASLRLEVTKAGHDAEALRSELAKAESDVQNLRRELDSTKEQHRILLDRLMREQASQDMQDEMKKFLSTAANTLARSQAEEATLIAWMRQERDESRCRLEIAERRCAELSDSLEKREDLLRGMRIEMEHYQTTLRRARLEHGTMEPRGLTDCQQILLMLCFRAWSFWYPRKLSSTCMTLSPSCASQPLDRSSRPFSARNESSSSIVEKTGVESWSHPVRPPSAARSQVRPSRTLPLRPSSAMASMRNGTLSRPTSATNSRSVTDSIGSGDLIKQLAAVMSSPVARIS